MSRILIVGCGYVGQALARLYLNQGAQVWALQRKPVHINGIKNILCDVNSITTNILPEVDIIFYLVSPDSYSEEAYVNTYEKGIKKLISSLEKNRKTPLLFCSSTRVYKQAHGEEVDENSITEPDDIFGKILLEGERSVLSTANGMVIRFGGVYGPGRIKLIEDILNQKVMLSPTPVYTNRIHLDDCVGILHFLASNIFPKSIFLGVDCKPVLYNDMLNWLASRLKAPMPSMGESPPQRLINSNKRCMNQKIISYGYKFNFPTFKDGYNSLLSNQPY